MGIDIVKIPKQLQNKKFKFIYLDGKRPTDDMKNWQNSDLTYEDVKNHTGNIGVINQSGNLIVIDVDSEKAGELAKQNLEPTFIVKSSKGKFHMYYHSEDIDFGKIIFKDNLGDIRGNGNYYTVIPPSVHPDTGQPYVGNDKPIVDITAQEVKDAFKSIIKKNKSTKKINPTDGIDKGGRDNTIFKRACKLRDNDVIKEDALGILLLTGKKCNPPLPEQDIIKCVNSAYNYEIKDPLKIVDLETVPSSLDELYKKLRHWLYIKNTDYIDLILATAVSNGYMGTPLWVFIMGSSSCGKSVIIRALQDMKGVEWLDQLTANTFASGMLIKGKPVNDMGSRLENKSTIIAMSDLASIKTMDKNQKVSIFGQMRTLFDGDIFKETGSGVRKRYTNCHVSFIAGTTRDFKADYGLLQQTGTRELVYEIHADTDDNDKFMKKAFEHIGKEKEMSDDIRTFIQGYIIKHPFKWVIIPPEIVSIIEEASKKMVIMRANPSFERGTGKLRDDVDSEVPARIFKQLCVLYQSLKTMDCKYPIEKFERIIKNIIKASGNGLRGRLLEFFKEDHDEWSLESLESHFNLGKRTIKSQCEVLRNMGLIKGRDDWIAKECGVASRLIETCFYRYYDKKSK